jgi:hypothetical protein
MPGSNGNAMNLFHQEDRQKARETRLLEKGIGAVLFGLADCDWLCAIALREQNDAVVEARSFSG